MGNLLLATILLPLAGAALAFGPRRRACAVALAAAVATLAMAATVVLQYPAGTAGEFAVFDAGWPGTGGPIDVRLSVGLDGLSLWLFGLTALVSVTAVLVGWESIRERAPAYYRLLLVLEAAMLGVFAARDVVLFYVFFEGGCDSAVLPDRDSGEPPAARRGDQVSPVYALRHCAGARGSRGDRRVGASSLAGRRNDVLDPATDRDAWPPRRCRPACSLGFLRRWRRVLQSVCRSWACTPGCRRRSSSSPAAGSVLLAGVLVTTGSYGLARFVLPMLPDAAALAAVGMMGLSVAGIVFGALAARAQTDIKRLVAYAGVGQMGFCTLGLFALTPLGLRGGVLQMINHGLAIGGLLAVAGMIDERYPTRAIADLGGLARRAPQLAALTLVMAFSSIGLPGLAGFISERMILWGAFQGAWAVASPAWALPLKTLSVLAALGVVLWAWFMLGLVRRVFFGPLREPARDPGEPPAADLSLREATALAPLAMFVVWIGIQPSFFLDRMSPALEHLTGEAQRREGVPTNGVGVEKRDWLRADDRAAWRPVDLAGSAPVPLLNTADADKRQP